MKFEDVLDDIAAIYQAVKFRRGVISPSGSLAKISWLHRLFDWLNPRQHKWHLVILAALGMGVILLLAEAINEDLSTNMNIALLVIAVFVGIEGLGVILGYFLFGEFLGIFRKE
jgi:hypothetical protein